MSLQYLIKEARDKVEFLHGNKYQSFLQGDFNTLGIKFPTRWYYHYWLALWSIHKVLKVISLQYLYNILKQKLGKEFIFLHPEKHQSFYQFY